MVSLTFFGSKFYGLDNCSEPMHNLTMRLLFIPYSKSTDSKRIPYLLTQELEKFPNLLEWSKQHFLM